MHFNDKTILITGAGLGIGRALAAAFVKDGANVLGVGRTESDLLETARLCGTEKIHCMVGDVTRPTDVAEFFDEAERRHGKVDILINNAAVYPKSEFLASSMDDWALAMDINVIGMARCCHRALPGMLERGHGRIINLGSFAWKGPIRGASAYTTSKGAVYALSRSIACEIDSSEYPDVLVNEVIPPATHTRMTPRGGEDPSTVYPLIRDICLLPPHGSHGVTFTKGGIYDEYPGLRTRLTDKLKRFLGRD